MNTKHKYLLIFLFVGFSFTACMFAEKKQNESEEIDKTELAAIESNGGQLFWKGSLDGKIPVSIQYQTDGDIGVGEIVYLNTEMKTPIKLLGYVYDDWFEFSEYDQYGEITGHIRGSISEGKVEGRWNTFYLTREYQLTASRVDTLIPTVDIKAEPKGIYGIYTYEYDENGGMGRLSAEKGPNDRFRFQISSTLGERGGYNMAIVDRDFAVLEKDSFIYQLPDTECLFSVRFYKDFACVRSIEGCATAFGMNASVDGFYIKRDDPYVFMNRKRILERMDKAVEKMNNTKTDNLIRPYSDIIDDDFNDFLSLGLEERNPFDRLIRRYGEPIKVETEKDEVDFDDDGKEIWIREFKTVDFTYFTFETFQQYLKDEGKYTEYGDLIYAETSTPGLGFGGIYVGVPECNKEYVKKLFSKLDPEQIVYDSEDNSIAVGFQIEHFLTDMTVVFDENDVVQKVIYRLAGFL